MKCERFKRFRQETYQMLGKAKDATFELADSVMTMRNASCLDALLHWTLPNFSTAKQSERWSDLMPLMTWQLWLAKDLVEEHHLPWNCTKRQVIITTKTIPMQ